MFQNMKKQLKLFSLLAVILIGTFAASSALFLSAANATYVEGEIVQNTIWTLTDSPFIVVKDVIVKPGFTLTIEPGVEVRFGGNFSLTVNGKLNATGTAERMITFTSNRLEPRPGDWKTVEFANRTDHSTLAYCVVEYAVNGITIDKGNAEIKNSQVSNNLQNGVYIKNDNSAYIHDNTVDFNKNGVFIADSSGSTIENNIISANSENGIYLQSSEGQYVNSISILSNTLSTNLRGIYVYGQVTTNIAQNSISYNDVGVYFQNATSVLPIQFNDVYGNICGMNVSASDTIDANYNYWGDAQGPYHPTLNPEGKGNSVQSDGLNLLFVWYLTASNGYVNARPVARLLSDKTLIAPNQPVTFIATTSSDDRRVDKYFFEFGDGRNSSWTTLSIVDHMYASVGTYQARLKVMDDFRVINDNDATLDITVQVLNPLEVSLSLSQINVVSAGQVSVTARATLGGSPVQSASISFFSVPAGTFGAQSGLTDSNGYFTTTFTAPSATERTDFRLTARAARGGNADGADHEYLSVVPPLSVEVTLDLNSIKSEGASNGTVHVIYNANPVEEVSVRISSNNGGSITPETGYTDAYGYLRFTFRAPQTSTQLNFTITATATKSGYWDGVGYCRMTVNPKTLAVEVTLDPNIAQSKETTGVIVHVSSDGSFIGNATVTLSSDAAGTFANVTGKTDANGDFRTAFTAPETMTDVEVTVTASANKPGYVNGLGQSKIAVSAAPSQSPGPLGLPLTTLLLLIIIPIGVVIVVVVLIKKRIIVFPRREED
jgi:parallel beta-helix repeat protein